MVVPMVPMAAEVGAAQVGFPGLEVTDGSYGFPCFLWLPSPLKRNNHIPDFKVKEVFLWLPRYSMFWVDAGIIFSCFNIKASAFQ